MIIAIEGNIGAGKSTLLRRLQHWGHTVVLEPVEAWKKWLEKGGDREFFEIVVLAWYISLSERLKKFAGSPTEFVYIERSPFTAKHVFWGEKKGLGEVRERVHAIAEKLLPVDIYIFLSDTPNECHRRIQGRKQVGDSGLSLEQLRKYDVAHWNAIRILHERKLNVMVW